MKFVCLMPELVRGVLTHCVQHVREDLWGDVYLEFFS